MLQQEQPCSKGRGSRKCNRPAAGALVTRAASGVRGLAAEGLPVGPSTTTVAEHLAAKLAEDWIARAGVPPRDREVARAPSSTVSVAGECIRTSPTWAGTVNGGFPPPAA